MSVSVSMSVCPRFASFVCYWEKEEEEEEEEEEDEKHTEAGLLSVTYRLACCRQPIQELIRRNRRNPHRLHNIYRLGPSSPLSRTFSKE